MQIRVLAFGVLQWSLGKVAIVDVPEGISIAGLLEHLRAHPPAGQPLPDLRSLGVSVNAEYSQNDRILHHGDEVAILPPAAGGALGVASPQPAVK